MPKKILKIEAFEGGINSNADITDIDKTEVADATDAFFGTKGQISCIGKADVTTELSDVGNSKVVEGYGLNLWQASYRLAMGGASAYTYWGNPTEIHSSSTDDDNSLWPFFSFSTIGSFPDMRGHPVTAANNHSDEYINGSFAYFFSETLGNIDPYTARDNWGFRIHVGTTVGTPLWSYPADDIATGNTSATVTDEHGNVNSFDYHIIEGDDGDAGTGGTNKKWVQMCPDFPISDNMYPTTDNLWVTPNYRYFFKSDGSGQGFSNEAYKIYWHNGMNENLDGVDPIPNAPGYGNNGQSNLLMALAAIINFSGSNNVSCTLRGEQYNYNQLDVRINPNKFDGDYTPSNYYVWVEYRGWSDIEFTSGTSSANPMNPYSEIGSLAGPDSLHQYQQFTLQYMYEDHNFLTIPEVYHTDNIAYGLTTDYIYTGGAADPTVAVNGQFEIDLPGNSNVLNLASAGIHHSLDMGNGSYYHYNRWASTPHLSRRIEAGLDERHWDYEIDLKELDGGDNAILGETYGLHITGPNIDGIKEVSQTYVTGTQDTLTEVVTSLATQIAESLGSEEITNGAFAADTDWTKGAGWTIDGVATCASGSTTLKPSSSLGLAADTYYKVQLDVTHTSDSGTLKLRLGYNDATNEVETNITGANQVFYLKTGTSISSDYLEIISNGFTGTVDNVSVKPVSSGIPGMTTTGTTGAKLKFQTSGVGASFDYQVEPFIKADTLATFDNVKTELLSFVSESADLHVAETNIGVWSPILNNSNDHKAIESIASADSDEEIQINITGHGYKNGDIVTIIGMDSESPNSRWRYGRNAYRITHSIANSFRLGVEDSDRLTSLFGYSSFNTAYTDAIAEGRTVSVIKLGQKPSFVSGNDSTFVGASNWANAAGANAFDSYDESTDLSLSQTNDDTDHKWALLDGAAWETDMVNGKKYVLVYNISIASYGGSGNISVGFCNDAATPVIDVSNTYSANTSLDTEFLYFTYNSSNHTKIIVHNATTATGNITIDNVYLYEVGTHGDTLSTLNWSESSPKTVSYSNAGALRICDADFNNSINQPKWIGYISKTGLFNSSGTTTNQVDIEGWYVKNQFYEYERFKHYHRVDETLGIEDKGSLQIKLTKANADDGEQGWTGVYKFYLTYLFDDGTETLPSKANDQHKVFYFNDTTSYELDCSGSDPQKLQISFACDPIDETGNYIFDERQKGCRIYFSKESEDHSTYYELGTLDFKDGFTQAGSTTNPLAWTAAGSDTSGYYADTGVRDIMNEYLGPLFELNTGYSPDNNVLLAPKYKCATVVNNVAWIGNVRYDIGDGYRNYPGSMLYSIPGKLDTFVYPDSTFTIIAEDGDEIIQLENFADRILQFKQNALFIVNIAALDNFFVEEEHRWKGVSSPNHVTWTPEGIVWANEYSCYMYDGRDVIDLMEASKGKFKDNRTISRDDWGDFFSSSSVVIYEPVENQVIIKRGTAGVTVQNNGDIYLLDLDGGGWSFGKDRFISNPTTNNPTQSNAIAYGNGNIYMLSGSDVDSTFFSNHGNPASGGRLISNRSTT
tara:strand:+ start:6229 stop:10845 length:4617 start_codon:yes stop_codon:yes gene_type:complete